MHCCNADNTLLSKIIRINSLPKNNNQYFLSQGEKNVLMSINIRWVVEPQEKRTSGKKEKKFCLLRGNLCKLLKTKVQLLCLIKSFSIFGSESEGVHRREQSNLSSKIELVLSSGRLSSSYHRWLHRLNEKFTADERC